MAFHSLSGDTGIYLPGSPVSFGCFLIRDENPTMVETGLRGMYDLVHGAVRRLFEY